MLLFQGDDAEDGSNTMTVKLLFCFCFCLLLDIFFIYISNVTILLVSTLEIPHLTLPPVSMIVFLHPPIESLPIPCHNIPLYWSIETSLPQVLFFPRCPPYKAILCYICSQSHGLIHVYSHWWFSPWEL